jgi:hypothetical protein
MTAEKSGVPAFAIVSTGFMRQARSTARILGIDNVWLTEYPGVIPNDSRAQLAEKVTTAVVPDLLQGFTSPVESATEATPEPSQRDTVFTGTLDEIEEHFHDQQWTDGLPIIPPTADRVRELLSFTERDPEEILGVLLPELREATVWNVAVNGVMAGCRPEYFPILLSVAEAICDPEFRVDGAGSTPGWEPLVIVSGRVAKQLSFNTEGGLMRVGRRANTSIGRFLRLYMRNVAGLRTPPGTTDKGSIGYSFNVALAEDEEVIAELGWPPFRVDQGFAPADDVVTVQSVVAISPPIYSGGDSPEDYLETIAYHMGTTCGPWAFTGVWFGRWHPLLLLSPSVAHALASLGWTKDDIRRRLFDQLTIEARWFERYPMHCTGTEDSLATRVNNGLIPPLYAESDDPDRQVPILRRPEWTGIVVAGDRGRNHSRVYVNNHEQGPPVSKRVVLPADWDARVVSNPHQS